GLASTEKAIQVNPRSARAMALAGELHLVTASRAKGAAERQDAAQRARSELEQAIQTNTLLRKEIGGSLVEAERLSAASGSRP
ncbi:MAG TPA: hypothetical protein VK459_27650, partial [Polyangiaceae bacterium]|nr:hypothetical protein [Polyangiaceae bacterium]